MSLPRRPTAVVFDLDGTLIDSEALVRDAYYAVCADFGLTITEAQFLSLVGTHRDATNEQLLGFYGPDFQLERFHDGTRTFIGERVAPLKPGALELIAAVEELGAPLGLATSSRRPWVERHFTAHGLSERFTAVVTRQDVENGKPFPDAYLKASQLLGAAPMHVLAIEDSHPGVRSAHAAGCMVVMAPDLLPANAEMREMALVVTSLHDVIALL